MMQRLVWLFFIPLAAGVQVPDFLLPDDVVPRRHSIELTIDPSRPSFTGQARIEVDLRAPP